MIKSTNNVTTIGNKILNAADTVGPPPCYTATPTKGHPSNHFRFLMHSDSGILLNYLLPMRDYHPSYQAKFQKHSGSKI